MQEGGAMGGVTPSGWNKRGGVYRNNVIHRVVLHGCYNLSEKINKENSTENMDF